MSIRVGGVSINFSVETKDAEDRLAKFVKRMSDLRLEGAIKGDPFKYTKKYLDEAKTELNSVFSDWATNIHDAEVPLNRFAERARENAKKIITAFESIGPVYGKYKSEIEAKSADILSFKKGGAGYGIDFSSIGGINSGKFGSDLAPLMGFTEEVDKQVLKLIDLVSKGKIRTEGVLREWFSDLQALIDSEGKSATQKYKQFGIELSKGFTIHEGLEIGAKQPLGAVKDKKAFIQERIALTRELIVKEAELRKNAREGIQTDQLSINLIKLYNDYKQKGAFLDGSRKVALASYVLEQERSKSVIETLNQKEKERQQVLVDLARVRKEAVSEARKAEEEDLKRKAKQLEEEAKALKKREEEERKSRERSERERDKEAAKRQKQREKEIAAEEKRHTDYAKQRASVYGVSEAPRELPRLASATQQVFKDQAMLMVNMRRHIEYATTAMSKGFNIEKNREAVLKAINTLKEAGVKLTQKEVEFEKTSEMLLKKQQGLKFKAAFKEAGDYTKILEERKKKAQELIIAEKRLREQQKLGIKTDTFRAELMKIYAERQKWNIGLTEKQALALKQYNDAQAASKDTGVFSKKWFQNRVMWFLQLRAFWGLYRKTIEGVKDLVEYENQLARALRTAASDTKSLTEITVAYGQAMKGAVQAHGVGWKEPAEALYQLGSAGLSAEEALSGLNSTLSLIVGTEGDTRDVTKAVAGIYNNFKDTLEGMISPAEKLAYINDLMAAAWKKHQVEIGELVAGYSTAAAISKLAGVNLKDLTAVLAVANDHMIKGGNAGRALSNVWSRISRSADEFADTFGVQIDSRKPMQFMEVMDKLAKKFQGVGKSVDWLGDAFDRMGLRGAPIFATLLQNWDKVKKASEELKDVTGEAAKLEKQRLDTLSGAWAQFVGRIRSYVANASDLLKISAQILRSWTHGLDILLGDSLVNIDATLLSLTKLKKVKQDMIDYWEKHPKLSAIFGVDLQQLKRDLEATGRAFDETLLKRLRLMGQSQVSRHELYRLEGKKKRPDEEETERYISEAERKFYRSLKGEDKDSRLSFLVEEAERLKKVLDKQQKTAEQIARIVGKTGESAVAWFDRARETSENLNKINKEIEGIRKENMDALKKVLTDNLSIEKDQLDIRIKAIDFEIKRLSIGAGVLANDVKINTLLNERKNIQDKLAENEARNLSITKDTNGEHMEGIKQVLKLTKETNNEEDEGLRQKIELAQLQIILNRLADEYNQKLDKKKEEIAIAKINHASQLKIAEAELESLNIQKEYLYTRKATIETLKNIVEREKQLASVNREILQLHTDILEKQEEYNRKSSIVYDWTQRVKDGLKEWHDVATDALVNFSQGIANISGEVFTDLTGGFQEQQQEVKNLEGELANLGRELKDAVSEGDVERVDQINQEMAELRSQIEELEDPIHNIKETFRDLFKDLIDNIRQAINEWIAMQIVMGIIKAAVPNPSMSGGKPTQYYGTGFETEIGLARGGILPNIKSFRSFSSGGVTSNPTLAVLGDNMSKRELVIPTENIQSNNVSGYMRDSDKPITIINLLTKEDVYSVMSEAQGQRVILNPIGKDLRDGGPLSKMIKG